MKDFFNTILRIVGKLAGYYVIAFAAWMIYNYIAVYSTPGLVGVQLMMIYGYFAVLILLAFFFLKKSQYLLLILLALAAYSGLENKIIEKDMSEYALKSDVELCTTMKYCRVGSRPNISRETCTGKWVEKDQACDYR